MNARLQGSCLSVVIPVFNEASTLSEVVQKVLSLDHLLEIIIVDDGSSDRTPELIYQLAASHSQIRCFKHERNLGKTAALRTGLAVTQGDVVIVQDADLEADPADIPSVIQPILEGYADVVYGSRFLGRRAKSNPFSFHLVGNKVLTFISNMLSNLKLTDMETCYKAFRGEIIRNMIIISSRFGFEVEATAKIAKLGCAVREVPISYRSRTYAEGKKIRVRDGIQALWLLLRFNLFATLHSSYRSVPEISSSGGAVSQHPQRKAVLAREFLILFGFLVLTIIMTWPWVTHLRDAASDPGDPYLNSWILWWDYHQTLHNPLKLFHANIFYPYRYSLAFSEHNYGIALLFFPLFAVGVRPLTIQGVATLLGFAFCGYGMFRLMRTLTGCKGAALVAGVTFAFIPYRFGQLPHLNYLFAGWIPLLLEALVLFTRKRNRLSAAWLGLAFIMNGLTCVHWFVLTLIPLALSAVLLVSSYNAWRDWNLWRRGLIAMAAAGLAMTPFLIPYVRAAKLYGFVRDPREALFFSALPIDWLVGEYRNKIWGGLHGSIRSPERSLFPGVLTPLLALAAIFIRRPAANEKRRWSTIRIIARLLDAAAIVSAILVIAISGWGHFDFYLFKLKSLAAVAIVLVLILLARLVIAYPEVLRHSWHQNLLASFKASGRSEAFWLGIIWTVLGFCGSLGMNFPFHRLLYEYIPLFRSIRVPARWAMICCLGLALLAGLGARRLNEWLVHQWPRVRPALLFAVLALAVLLEQRSAPLDLIHGAVDPDRLTLKLKGTPMKGGIVELPTKIGEDYNYLYTLRAADHAKPLVTAVSGFVPPLQNKIQSLTETETITDEFMDVLESIPCSYLVVHNKVLGIPNELGLKLFARKQILSGRLRFIDDYDNNYLYAVVKTEPDAAGEAPVPASVMGAAGLSLPEQRTADNDPDNPIDDPAFFTRMQYLDFLGREPESGGLAYWMTKILACGNEPLCIDRERGAISAAFFDTKEFQDTGFFIYRVYKATLGRPPHYQEFIDDRAKLSLGTDLDSTRKSFVDGWIKRREFSRLYPPKLPADQFVDGLVNGIASTSGVSLENQRRQLIDQLNAGGSRANVVSTLAQDQAFSKAEYNRAFVLTQYFAYFKRDPDAASYAFWVDALNKRPASANVEMVRTFVNSKEYRARFAGRKANENSKR